MVYESFDSPLFNMGGKTFANNYFAYEHRF